MHEILLYYQRPDPVTWVYLSSFLTVGLFFVFRRFWSIRNLDILMLIMLAPGLLTVHEGYRRQFLQVPESEPPQEAVEPIEPSWPRLDPDQESAQRDWVDAYRLTANLDAELEQVTLEAVEDDATPARQFTPKEIQRWGLIWLFVVEAFILIRLMLDPVMTRRPLLEPNLTTGGLNFLGISLFIFMMANVVLSDPQVQITQGPALGPGYAMMNMLPAIPTRTTTDTLGADSPFARSQLSESQTVLAQVAKALAVLAHLGIVAGVMLIGKRHFGNLRTGVGCATLYLIMPYTAQMTGRVDHALPAALLVWALLFYHKPFIAGVFLGLAGGLVYYPLFLLPLWFSFYWRRGAREFGIGVAASLAFLMLALSFDDSASLVEHLRRMFGLFIPSRDASELLGIWGLGWYPIWRLPVIVAFVILSVFFAIWPAQKNLATLISGSGALMVAAQFWHGYGGGLYIAWFLPLLLLVIFRPNLLDRIATKVVAGGSKSTARSRLQQESV